jgi:hypothetical protein
MRIMNFFCIFVVLMLGGDIWVRSRDIPEESDLSGRLSWMVAFMTFGDTLRTGERVVRVP